MRIFKGKKFKTIFAFVDSNNIPLLKILNRFQFKLLGRVPCHDKYRFYLIYGRIYYYYKPKTIHPHAEICQSVKNIIEKAEIDKIKVEKGRDYINIKRIEFNIKIIKKDDAYPLKIKIFQRSL